MESPSDGGEPEQFRARVREFFQTRVVPDYGSWEAAGAPPEWFWSEAAKLGMLGIGVPTEYGGLEGSTFRHSAAVTEEAQLAGLALGGLRVHTDIVMPYFLKYADADQKRRWLPELTGGRAVTAIAITEPDAGSDMKAMTTRAQRDGDHYVINGSKTFITNGSSANLIILCAKTDPEAGRRGISLFAVETDTPGFTHGRRLRKLGLRTQDLAELSFSDMVVPAASLLGEENQGFSYLTSNLAQERLSIALNAQAGASALLRRAVETVRASAPALRGAQRTKFALAACQAEVDAGQAFAERAVTAHCAGELSEADAASFKLYATELQGRVAERCVEAIGIDAFSRAGFVGRAYADARVGRIYGGSSEIMKVIVAKAMEL